MANSSTVTYGKGGWRKFFREEANFTSYCIIGSTILWGIVIPITFVIDSYIAKYVYQLYSLHNEQPYVWFVRARYEIMLAHGYITEQYLVDFLLYDIFVLISTFWAVVYISLSAFFLNQRDLYRESIKRTGSSYLKFFLTGLVLGGVLLYSALSNGTSGGKLLDPLSEALPILLRFPKAYICTQTFAFAGSVVGAIPESIILGLWWIARGRFIETAAT